MSGGQEVLQGTADIAANGRVDRNVGRQILEKTMNTALPPLPKKPPAAFHHPLGFELYDRLAMDLHAMAYAELMLQELETLRRHIADIGDAMRTKANNNPDGVKASTLEMLGNELLSALPSNA